MVNYFGYTFRRMECRVGKMNKQGNVAVSDPGMTRSVQRALLLLEEISRDPNGIGVSDLGLRAELPVSTVHRLLATLMASGFVVQDAENGRYRVGLRAFEVGNAFLRQVDLAGVARPAMRELRTELNESVNLAVRDGFGAVYIDHVDSDQMLKLFTRTGSRVQLYCTGVGKVVLADLPPEDVETYIQTTTFTPRTPHTVVDPDMLRSQLDRVRARGFAIDDEEFELGVRCVAAPIRDHSGSTVAALSVSGPAQRITRNSVFPIAQSVSAMAQNISSQLGYLPNNNPSDTPTSSDAGKL